MNKMNDMTSLFSVIIPLYNKEIYIYDTISSVLNQTYSKFDLIVINDGSTDNSLEIIKGIRDPRLRVISQKNSGVSAARNNGITLAKSKWIVFLDADDIWLPNHLETLLAVNNKFPNAWMIATGHQALKREDININLKRNTKPKIKLINYFMESQRNISIINSSCVAIKKEFFDHNYGFKDYKRGEDLELWARVALNYPVAISTAITSIYVQGTGGAMDTGFWSKNKPVAVENIKLEDISPSSAFLYSALSGKYSTDIVNYINARVMSHIRANCIRRDAKTAKKLRSFLVKPIKYNKLSERLYKITLSLPIPVINFIFYCRYVLVTLLKKYIEKSNFLLKYQAKKLVRV